ncbi:MAG: Holliday junction resolvase [Thermoplasmatota archaeon]
MSSTYERELKGVLGGDEATLRALTKAMEPEAAKNYWKSQSRPFLVVRAAGSLGVDLVALRGDVSFPIEVKSAAADAIRFSDGSGRNNEQAARMSAECVRAAIIPLYAYRRKGLRGEDAWRVYTLPTSNLPPRIVVLYDRLPKVAQTDGGSFVLRWADGLPLNRFIEYLC